VNQTPTGWPELTNANGVQISSMLFVRKEKAMGSWMIADPLSIGMPTAPAGNPAIQYLVIRQNVAGLWLKCGVCPANIAASLRRKILPDDATIC
jgi:hypothetical protein